MPESTNEIVLMIGAIVSLVTAVGVIVNNVLTFLARRDVAANTELTKTAKDRADEASHKAEVAAVASVKADQKTTEATDQLKDKLQEVAEGINGIVDKKVEMAKQVGAAGALLTAHEDLKQMVFKNRTDTDTLQASVNRLEQGHEELKNLVVEKIDQVLEVVKKI